MFVMQPCPQCKQKIPTGINFCPYCGQRLSVSAVNMVTPSHGAPVEAVIASPPIDCNHQYEHFVCIKCGEKAPKPLLKSLGISTRDQYTYEYYMAASPEEARYFLDHTQVTKPFYYVMVETPEGKWGRDKDGLFLERLCDFQRNLSLAQCDGDTNLIPLRLEDLGLAANKITDNYLIKITCGSCNYEWVDGVAYRAKTIVRCPECGQYNLANTEHIRYNTL